MFPTCSLLVQTDLHREIIELADSTQHMTLEETRGVVQRMREAARRGVQIATCRTPRDPVDRPVRGRGVSRGGTGSCPERAPAPNVAGSSSWHRGGSTAGHFGGEHDTFTFASLFRTAQVTNGNLLLQVLSSTRTRARTTRSRPSISSGHQVTPPCLLA